MLSNALFSGDVLKDDDFSVVTLFKPQSSARQHPTAHLYAPYSIKLHRRVYLYTHIKYELWVIFESDPNIISFNENVSKLPIVVNGMASNKSPLFLTRTENKSVTVHVAIDSKDDENGIESAWIQFSSQKGFLFKNWNKDEFTSRKMRISNYKKLLRYTSSLTAEDNYSLESRIITFLESHRKNTLINVIREFPSTDPEVVKISLARLILNNKVLSDLDIYPLNMLTEVSIYHDFKLKEITR
jgi:hypothetical protein